MEFRCIIHRIEKPKAMFNNNSNLYGSEWLATVFTDRNQQYGAYLLRKQSSQHLLKALFITVPIFVAVFLVPGIIKRFDKNVDVVVKESVQKEFDVDIIHRNVEKEVRPSPAKAEVKAPKVVSFKAKSVAMSSNFKVVSDNLVSLSPPTSADIENAIIGSISQEGVEGKLNVIAGAGGEPAGGVAGKGEGGGNEIMDATGVDVSPEFPGGMSAWSKYIQNNLKYPGIAQEEGIQGKVFLSFVVEKNGTITDVKVLKGIGYGCDDEAVRVIKKSPRWKAGMQNNLPVRVKYTMPISYTVNK